MRSIQPPFAGLRENGDLYHSTRREAWAILGGEWEAAAGRTEGRKMIFADRQEAGRKLAGRLARYAGQPDVLVLGIPRGGVPVAFEVSQFLHAPLDIFLSRKLGVPGQEELAFGAIAAGDGRFLDREIIARAGIQPDQVEQITRATAKKLEHRAQLYRQGHPAFPIEGRQVIVIDDGIATGSSIYAAIRALRHMRAKRLVVATPVAPADTVQWLRQEVDELVCLEAPRTFYAVGQFYQRFPQVSDEEVIALLKRAAASSSPADPPAGVHPLAGGAIEEEVSIDLGGRALAGTLSIPDQAQGLVLFAHGSGSSRHSPRNRYVAARLQSARIATLLFDLLTPEEEAADRWTGELRFNIPLLGERLEEATRWARRQPRTEQLGVGYFGASTGAAAALVAASALPESVLAVVSRGGRPDLAYAALGRVTAATLLIVGSLDEDVIALNRQALARLRCEQKRLAIVRGATHLFEERGALEQVADLAVEWFRLYLRPLESPVSRSRPALTG